MKSLYLNPNLNLFYSGADVTICATDLDATHEKRQYLKELAESMARKIKNFYVEDTSLKTKEESFSLSLTM